MAAKRLVELPTQIPLNALKRLCHRQSLAVRARAGHGVERIAEPDHACRVRNDRTHQTLRIALAVRSLMVRAHGIRGPVSERVTRQQTRADVGVGLDGGPLFTAQRRGLAQDGVRDADLAQVMQEQADHDQVPVELGVQRADHVGEPHQAERVLQQAADLVEKQRLEQRMHLSQQMLQNLELLQLPIMDLRDLILQELEENPTLEEKAEGEYGLARINMVRAERAE